MEVGRGTGPKRYSTSKNGGIDLSEGNPVLTGPTTQGGGPVDLRAGRAPSAYAHGWLTRHVPEALGLALVITGVFVLRWVTLAQLAYPPSADAAGDLVWLHTYSGHPLPGYTLLEAPPPDYFFLVLWPAIHAYGIFDGIRVIMALVPALYALPAYFLVRWAGLGTFGGLVTSALMAGSAAFSEMVTWNSAFNATGIMFLLGFLAFAVRGLTRPEWRSAVAAGVCLSLVAGTHVVTFLYGVAVVILLTIVVLLVLRKHGGPFLRWLAPALATTGVLFVPYAGTYYDNFVITANVGPPASGSSTQQLLFTYSQALGFPWGTNTPVPEPSLLGAIILADMIATLLAIALVWRCERDRPMAFLTTALLIGGILLAALDPGNSIRAIYFLPLAYIPALAVGTAGLLREPLRWPERARRIARRVSPRTGGRRARRRAIYLLALTFLALNLVVSQEVMTQSEHYYLELSPAKVATLNWVNSNTSPNAVFFDGAGLQTWLLGYSDRLAYSPSYLSSKVTNISYTNAFRANLVDLGGYVLGNSQLYLSSNVPGAYNTPGVFLRTPDYSIPLWLGETDRTWITVANGSSRAVLDLVYGQAVNVSGTVAPNGTAQMTTGWSFPGGERVVEILTLDSGTTTVQFRASPVPVVRAVLDLRAPPSGYFDTYPSYANATLAGSFAENAAVPFIGNIQVTTNGPGLSAQVRTEPTGWTSMNLTTIGQFSMAVNGWAGVTGASPFFVDTLELARQLGVNYFLVSDLTDYPLFERLFALSTQGYARIPAVYVSGDITVFAFP